jgi:hypothetical protein
LRFDNWRKAVFMEQRTAGTLAVWVFGNNDLLLAAQPLMAEFLATFIEFPPL